MEKDLRELIKDSVDMHFHCVPDVSVKARHSRSNHEMVDAGHAAGMHGYVLKNSGFPNIGLADELNNKYEDFRVYSSVTLNAVAGGVYPWVAEMAAEMDVDLLWLPTWGAQGDQEHSGFAYMVPVESFVQKLKDQTGAAFQPVLDENGELDANYKGVIDICRQRGMVLCSGHLTPEEALACAKYSKETGFDKFCLTHPLHPVNRCTKEQAKEIADLGAHVELTASTVEPLYGCTTIAETAEWINFIGADHCYIASDRFWDWEPAVPENLFQYVGCLYDTGVSYEDLDSMMHHWKKLLRD